MKFQGKPGIPRLVAYYSEPTINNVMVYYALEEYPSRAPQPSLSTEDMVRQLLRALKLIHEECVEVGAISLNTIRWHGDEIKVQQEHQVTNLTTPSAHILGVLSLSR